MKRMFKVSSRTRIKQNPITIKQNPYQAEPDHFLCLLEWFLLEFYRHRPSQEPSQQRQFNSTLHRPRLLDLFGPHYSQDSSFNRQLFSPLLWSKLLEFDRCGCFKDPAFWFVESNHCSHGRIQRNHCFFNIQDFCSMWKYLH